MGTAIALLVRKARHKAPAVVRFRDMWGQTKREDLVASLGRFSTRMYEKVTPERPLGLPFRLMGTDSRLPHMAAPGRSLPGLVSRSAN